MNRFSVAGRPVGPDHPPYVIAEAGVHHRNSVKLAEHYIADAAAAGADAIKFQTYDADRLVTRWAPTYKGSGSQTQHDIFSTRSRLSRDDYARLFRFAERAGITLLSTPFDPDAARMLDELGMAAFKVASADLTNDPLLQAVAACKKPIILSTGASTLDEVSEALELLAAYDVPVALLHCNLSYPTPIAQANLGRIGLLRARFPDGVVGYSDHTQPQDSMIACPLAVGLGAAIIEKHYTHDRSLPDDDHFHAVDTAGLALLVKDCREAALMVGGAVEMTESEADARKFARRSIVAARDVKAGAILGEQDLDCKRPGTGLSPGHWSEIIGRRLRTARGRDELLSFDDLE